MSQPNFILIMTDTQATNVVGCYGRPEMRTPHIDRLAQNGIRFDKAYTTCPLCTPARAALFTGIYSHTSGPWTNNLALGTNIHTMGQRLRDGGYQTAYVGKWHLDGHDYFGTGISPDGWDADFWYDGANYLSELTQAEIRLWRYGLPDLASIKEHDIRAEFTWAHRVSDRAIQFLTRRDSRKPFLLVVSYDEPHHPFTCPAEFIEPFTEFNYPLGPAAHDSQENKPIHQREWAASRHHFGQEEVVQHPMYFGCNSFVDSEIGRVIDAAHELAQNDTYILFTSDHGDMLGAHQLDGKGPAIYEEITHIPLIIQQPDFKGAGKTCATLVSHIDILPTLLELSGLGIPPILEGDSLVPQLQGVEDSDKKVFIEFNRYEIEHDSFGGFQPLRAILGGSYKLAINLLTSDEFYDLSHDPAEVDNLIEHPDYAALRNDYHDLLLDWMYEKRDPFRAYYWERRPWRAVRRLQWKGLFRPRPADGYAPPVRAYDTGLPAHEVKVEHEHLGKGK